MSNWSPKSKLGALPNVTAALSLLPTKVDAPSKYLVLGDVHANWHALVAVLRHAQPMGCDATLFLGDMVGYGPRPKECVEFLRRGLAKSGPWIAGNHDFAVAETTHFALKGYRQAGDARTSCARHRDILVETAPDELAWLKTQIVEERARLRMRTVARGALAFVHGEPREEVGTYVYPNEPTNQGDALCELRSEGVMVSEKPFWLLSGHTHCVCLSELPGGHQRARLRAIRYGEPQELATPDAGYWINPGSVGQPRDGDPRAAYAVLDTEAATVTHYRVPYDTLSVQRELQTRGYLHESSALAETISTGHRARVTHEHFDSVYARLPDEAGVTPK